MEQLNDEELKQLTCRSNAVYSKAVELHKMFLKLHGYPQLCD